MEMTLGDALVFSLLGILVVFFALFLLMCIIKFMTFFDGKVSRSNASAAAPAPAEESPCVRPAPGAAGELKLYDTDPLTAAMLMAIVADELKAPLNELRFISIREIREEREER